MREVMENDKNVTSSAVLSRAQGCLLGQLIGDSLGSLVEFQRPERIRSTISRRRAGYG